MHMGAGHRPVADGVPLAAPLVPLLVPLAVTSAVPLAWWARGAAGGSRTRGPRPGGPSSEVRSRVPGDQRCPEAGARRPGKPEGQGCPKAARGSPTVRGARRPGVPEGECPKASARRRGARPRASVQRGKAPKVRPETNKLGIERRRVGSEWIVGSEWMAIRWQVTSG